MPLLLEVGIPIGTSIPPPASPNLFPSIFFQLCLCSSLFCRASHSPGIFLLRGLHAALSGPKLMTGGQGVVDVDDKVNVGLGEG